MCTRQLWSCVLAVLLAMVPHQAPGSQLLSWSEGQRTFTSRLAGLQAKHGTPCYMAPELFQDGSTHSTASDLWALGCVLYECAAGRPPFVSSSLTHLVSDILATEPAPLPEGEDAGAHAVDVPQLSALLETA